ncbi:nucleotidyltransferase family protein [Pseudostreptobacillus hongkongensis]|uniref:nucleotidyltransferase family protein n=1 Tax=Pseudostreptobacillus hongkongensis TaxID=1162717 RepID=UPI00082F70E9|nr:nucleotidyltransferase family protein [Pseudostreptobacillus hongkongensis]
MKNKVFGVVAEFNPFHNGHKYQVEKIRQLGADVLIAVVSGDFVQRGEVSLLSKFDKAELAILNGYDIVVELPAYYAIQNADIFSEFSTKILEVMKVDYQVFGIEENDISDIEKIIEIQNKEEYINKLLEYQKEGYSYIKSHELVLSEYNLSDKYKSNNILAISYIRSILRNKMNMRYIGIKRKSVDYNSDYSLENMASASYIRNNIYDEKIKKFIPSNTFDILYKNVNDIKSANKEIFKIFKYIINVKSKKEIIKVYDFNDTIYNRVIRYINKSKDFDEFISQIVTRNISKNRVKRLILNVLLDISRDDISIDNNIEYVRVLSMNEKGAKYIKSLNDDKIYVNWKDIEKNIQGKKIKLEKNSFILSSLLLNKNEKLNVKYIK